MNEIPEHALSARIEGGQLVAVLHDPIRVDRDIALLTVTLTGPSFRASRQFHVWYTAGFAPLVDYFDKLDASWRGWDGPLEFDSLEGDLQLVATHDGHVRLRVVIREYGWKIDGTLTIEPGEQLSRIADEVRSLERLAPSAKRSGRGPT